jgi:acetylglutamate kinase
VTPGPVVIKVGGTTLEDPATSGQLWDAVARLTQGRPVVLVHGGGKAVDKLLDRLGMTVTRVEGLRVTAPDQIDYITGVLAGTINKRIVAQLSRRGVKAVGLCLGDGDCVPTQRKRLTTADLGLVGEPALTTSSTTALLPLLCTSGYTPILSSIGIAQDGELLNVNADDAALGAALSSHASTLILMTDVPGILDASKRLIPTVDATAIDRLIADSVITGGMIPKARAALAAAQRLKAPVVILSGNDPESLARWASGAPSGTTVLPPH